MALKKGVTKQYLVERISSRTSMWLENFLNDNESVGYDLVGIYGEWVVLKKRQWIQEQ